MKTFLSFFLFVILSVNSGATECTPHYFIEKHINLGLCQYHVRESLDLLYAARVKAINEYIAAKIERGELEDKKFEISMDDPNLSLRYMEIINSSKACYVIAGNIHLDLERLKLIVDACCNPNFKYIVAESNENTDASEYMDKQLKRYAKGYESEISVFEFDIWKKDSLSITYKSDKDELCYTLCGKTLPYKPYFGMPAVIHDRYIIPVLINDNWNIDHLIVYEDSVQIKKFKLPYNEFGDEYFFQPNVYGKWVNWGYNEIIYSYSYDKNRFYHFDPALTR